MTRLILLLIACVLTQVLQAQCVANVSISVDVNPVCQGSTATFTATATGDAGSSPNYRFVNTAFNFEFGNGTNNQASTNLIFSGDKIEVEMTPNDGCAVGTTIKDDIIVTTTFGPTPSINEPSSSICDGDSYELTANVKDANTYEWYKDGSATGNFTKTLLATEQGQYTIIEDNGSCPPEESDPKEVTVLEVPTVDAGPDLTIAPGSSETINGSSNYTSNISWTPTTYLDDPNSLTPVCSPPVDGNTTVYTLTSYNAQCSASDQMTVLVSFITSTSTDQEFSGSLYPNPATTNINLPEHTDYYLYDFAGNLVSHGYGLQFSVAEIPNGFYTVIFLREGVQVKEKVAITH